MSSASCLSLKALHLAYGLVTYAIIPYVFADNQMLQYLNALNICLLLLHWKFFGDRCALSIIEKDICPEKLFKAVNNRLVGLPDFYLSNLTQFLVVIALYIAINTIFGKPLAAWQRLLLPVLSIAVIFVFIPLQKLYQFVNLDRKI